MYWKYAKVCDLKPARAIKLPDLMHDCMYHLLDAIYFINFYTIKSFCSIFPSLFQRCRHVHLDVNGKCAECVSSCFFSFFLTFYSSNSCSLVSFNNVSVVVMFSFCHRFQVCGMHKHIAPPPGSSTPEVKAITFYYVQQEGYLKRFVMSKYSAWLNSCHSVN